MGFFWEGLPPYVIGWSRTVLGPRVVAVETGTFRGDTSALLARAFGSCVTIERSASLADRARERFAGNSTVTVLEGSSRDRLAEALPPTDQPAFFWLDAHGIYDYDGSDAEENPLLHELETILSMRGDGLNVIAVDDARGMGTQPGWPPLNDVFAILGRYGYMGVIIDDALVAAPTAANADFFGLYKHSRMVEVSAVFHVWKPLTRVVKARAWSDAAVVKAKSARKPK